MERDVAHCPGGAASTVVQRSDEQDSRASARSVAGPLPVADAPLWRGGRLPESTNRVVSRSPQGDLGLGTKGRRSSVEDRRRNKESARTWTQLIEPDGRAKTLVTGLRS